MKFLSQTEDFYVAICLSYSKGLVTNLVLRPDHPFWTHALRKKWFVCTTRAVCQHSHICIAYVRECVSFHSQTDAHYVICSKSLLGTAHERKQIISIPTSLCEWIVFRWQPHHYVICLSAKGNWFAQRLEWTVVCQRSRSPHSYLRTEIHSLIRYHLRKAIHSLSSLSAQSIASSSYLRTEIHSSNILWKAIDSHKG